MYLLGRLTARGGEDCGGRVPPMPTDRNGAADRALASYRSRAVGAEAD